MTAGAWPDWPRARRRLTSAPSPGAGWRRCTTPPAWTTRWAAQQRTVSLCPAPGHQHNSPRIVFIICRNNKYQGSMSVLLSEHFFPDPTIPHSTQYITIHSLISCSLSDDKHCFQMAALSDISISIWYSYLHVRWTRRPKCHEMTCWSASSPEDRVRRTFRTRWSPCGSSTSSWSASSSSGSSSSWWPSLTRRSMTTLTRSGSEYETLKLIQRQHLT